MGICSEGGVITPLCEIQCFRFCKVIGVLPSRSRMINASSSPFGVLADFFAVVVASSFLGEEIIISATGDESTTPQFDPSWVWGFCSDGTEGNLGDRLIFSSELVASLLQL